MALIACRECGTEISSKAVACPKCGAPIPKPLLQQNIGCGGLLLILFIVGLIASVANRGSGPPAEIVTTSATPVDPRAEATKAAERKTAASAAKRARQAKCSGIDHSGLDQTLLQRLDNDGRDVYVTAAWYGLGLDAKQNLARYLYTCRSDEHPIRVYDSRTGKKLAAYDSGWGYSNYED